MSRELIIAPRPDDEIIGCGGTIIKLLDRKHEVGVVYLSSGDDAQAVREQEAKDVCNYLSLDYFQFLRLNGPSFTTALPNIEALIHIFSDFRPDFLFINHREDGDQEHQVAHELVSQALWRYNERLTRTPIRGMAYYEVHKPMSKYQLVEDISEVMPLKLKALSLYRSQLAKAPWDRAVVGLNQFRGAMHEGYEYAEVFQLHKIKNLSETLSNE